MGTLKAEQLLQQRILVQNNYPRSPYKHYEIITDPTIEEFNWAKQFTVNFRMLDWFEFRSVEEMPSYLKKPNGEIIHAKDWVKHDDWLWSYHNGTESCWLLNALPATEKEIITAFNKEVDDISFPITIIP